MGTKKCIVCGNEFKKWPGFVKYYPREDLDYCLKCSRDLTLNESYERITKNHSSGQMHTLGYLKFLSEVGEKIKATSQTSKVDDLSRNIDEVCKEFLTNGGNGDALIFALAEKAADLVNKDRNLFYFINQSNLQTGYDILTLMLSSQRLIKKHGIELLDKDVRKENY